MTYIIPVTCYHQQEWHYYILKMYGFLFDLRSLAVYLYYIMHIGLCLDLSVARTLLVYMASAVGRSMLRVKGGEGCGHSVSMW